jgi:hypothetical protein
MLLVVVAVTASNVEVLPAGPVDELGRLTERCSELAAENEQLWAEVIRVVENERLLPRVWEA